MQQASNLFTSESRQRINAAVADAESKTSAEIVPMVVAASGRYDRAEDMAGLWLALTGLIVAWVLFQRQDPAAGGWDGPQVALGLPTLIVILLAGFIAGAFAASRIGWVRRLFTARAQMMVEVNDAARLAFFDQRIHHTTGRGGVLLYVSLFERIAVVIGDDHVVEKLGKPALEELCSLLTTKLRSGSPVEALHEIINVCGERLAAALPRLNGDVNELPDALITVD